LTADAYAASFCHSAIAAERQLTVLNQVVRSAANLLPDTTAKLIPGRAVASRPSVVIAFGELCRFNVLRMKASAAPLSRAFVTLLSSTSPS